MAVSGEQVGLGVSCDGKRSPSILQPPAVVSPCPCLRGPPMRMTRRDMVLTSSALAGAALATPSGLAAADEKPTDRKFKKAVKIGMVKAGNTLLEKFQLLKELGFDGVELDAPSRVTVEEAKKCIGKTGLL